MNAASEAAKVVQGLQQTTQGIAGASDKAVQGIETARRAEQQALQVGYNRVADGGHSQAHRAGLPGAGGGLP
jgi:hypothetical protein